MLKKAFFILLIFGGCLFGWPEIAWAEGGGVSIKATVLPPKMTDTINDFIYQGQDYTRPAYKAILGASTDVPYKVSAVKNESPKRNFQFRWQYLLFLLPIGGLYWPTIHLRKSKPSEEQKFLNGLSSF